MSFIFLRFYVIYEDPGKDGHPNGQWINVDRQRLDTWTFKLDTIGYYAVNMLTLITIDIQMDTQTFTYFLGFDPSALSFPSFSNFSVYRLTALRLIPVVLDTSAMLFDVM